MMLLRRFCVLPILCYQTLISPGLSLLLGPGTGCRFQPTCSAFAKEAILRFGIVAGIRLALGRLCRCHPWGKCGPDPVPDAPFRRRH